MGEQEEAVPRDEAAQAPAGQAPRTSRRVVLKVLAAGAAGAATGIAVPMVVSRMAGNDAPPAWRFFTDAEGALVEAVCSVIIPTDDDPGAKEAGVVNYIDQQLIGHYRKHQQAYRAGLAALQASCKEMFGRKFGQIGDEERIRFLEAMESGEVKGEQWKGQSAGDFFRMMVQHTMQGFYGGPRHGGNKDYVSYRMLGLEVPRVIGRNIYK